MCGLNKDAQGSPEKKRKVVPLDFASVRPRPASCVSASPAARHPRVRRAAADAPHCPALESTRDPMREDKRRPRRWTKPVVRLCMPIDRQKRGCRHMAWVCLDTRTRRKTLRISKKTKTQPVVCRHKGHSCRWEVKYQRGHSHNFKPTTMTLLASLVTSLDNLRIELDQVSEYLPVLSNLADATPKWDEMKWSPTLATSPQGIRLEKFARTMVAQTLPNARSGSTSGCACARLSLKPTRRKILPHLCASS